MELLQLQYFAEVARQESYTKAAQALHVSQPALSQTVKRLETEVGVRLFEREGRNVRLTASGRSFYARITQSLAEIQAAYDDLTNNRLQGNILIGSYMPLYPILDCLRAFTDRNPDITFYFHYMTDSTLRTRQFDSLLYYSQSDNLGFNEEIALGEVIGSFAVPVDFPAGEGTSLRLADLQNAPFVSLAREDGWVEEIFQNFSHSGRIPNIRYRTNSSLLKQELMEAGLAVGSSNDMLIRHFQKTGKYRSFWHAREAPGERSFSRVRLYMGWRDSDYLSPAARAFKEFCKKWFPFRE